MKINSKRTYTIAIADESHILTESLSIDEILCNDYDVEYMLSLKEMIDEILDMKEGQSMYFQWNRDNPNSKAIIVRVV